MSEFKGRRAVVTGAASGIGRALAQALNAQGCALHLCDVNETALQETAALLDSDRATCEVRILDVADHAAMQQWAADIAADHGAVDIVINNAGVGLMARAEEGEYEDIRWLMGINFWGVVHGTRAFLPLLRRSATGRLVNISSIFGMVGIPSQSAYNAAKFAVRGYTEAIREDLKDTGIHVCCVHPGGIRTNIARDSRGEGEDGASRDARFKKIARTSPEDAAAAILKAMEKRRKQLLIGADARYLALVARLFPVSYHRFIPDLDKLVN